MLETLSDYVSLTVLILLTGISIYFFICVSSGKSHSASRHLPHFFEAGEDDWHKDSDTWLCVDDNKQDEGD